MHDSDAKAIGDSRKKNSDDKMKERNERWFQLW